MGALIVVALEAVSMGKEKSIVPRAKNKLSSLQVAVGVQFFMVFEGPIPLFFETTNFA